MMRRLRALLAWAVVLWGAGMSVPPIKSEEPAHYAPRIIAAQRVAQVEVAAKSAARPRLERPLPPAAPVLPAETLEDDFRPRIYVLHRALLL